MLILKQVVEGCHGWKAAGGGLSQPGVFQDLHLLSEPERLALVLIDILGLGYPDAARVADWPVNEVARRLAQARLKIAHPKEMHVS